MWAAGMACLAVRDGGGLHLDIAAAVTLAATLEPALPAWAALAMLTAIAAGAAEATQDRTKGEA